MSDANNGRGVFSKVIRVTLEWSVLGPETTTPTSVVVKLATDGPNGEAARVSGAYDREALAYSGLLANSTILTPRIYLVEPDSTGATTLVMEDLTSLRMVDQLDGLDDEDALSVAGELGVFHRMWQGTAALDRLTLRRATPTAFAPEPLALGMNVLRERWNEPEISPWFETFERLLADRSALVERFAAAAGATLCHGDPRADNMAFAPTGRPVLFDWQQIAVQLGEADLAWLAATSLKTDDRRRLDDDLILAYGGSIDRYRTGLVLPGLAVLFLAQRRLDDERSRRFVATSIARIGAAISDFDVPNLAADRP